MVGLSYDNFKFCCVSKKVTLKTVYKGNYSGISCNCNQLPLYSTTLNEQTSSLYIDDSEPNIKIFPFRGMVVNMNIFLLIQTGMLLLRMLFYVVIKIKIISSLILFYDICIVWGYEHTVKFLRELKFDMTFS